MRVSPLSFGVLPPTDLKKVDLAGRKILERVGIRLLDHDFLGTLDQAGAWVDYDHGRVRFPESVLGELLSEAPSSFTLFSRDGKNDLHLGEGHVYFANGGRVFRMLDMETNDYRSTFLLDVARTASLVDRLEHIRLYIIACQAYDLESQNYHLNDFYQALNHTTKHVMGGCDTLDGVMQVWELACTIAGDEELFREKPFVSIITNPVSPLTLDSLTLKTLHFSVTHGIPVTCAPAPISGATAPATLAGTLAQMHAEALAGVALGQVFSPGAKMLYGAVPTTMDLRNMGYSMGSIEMAIMNAAAVQLAKRNHLPIYASAGVTEAKEPDIQTGTEKSSSNLLVALSGPDCVHLAAGMLDSGNAIAYEQFFIDNEIVAMVHRVLAGITVDEATLGLSVIENVGPGGDYVLADHTVDHMLQEFFYPDLAVRMNLNAWEADDRPDMLSRARDQVREFFSRQPQSVLDRELLERLRQIFPAIRDI